MYNLKRQSAALSESVIFNQQYITVNWATLNWAAHLSTKDGKRSLFPVSPMWAFPDVDDLLHNKVCKTLPFNFNRQLFLWCQVYFTRQLNWAKGWARPWWYSNLGSHWEMHEVKVQVVQFQVTERLLTGSPHQRRNVEGAPQLWKSVKHTLSVSV